MRELSVTEQRYQAVLAVISDGETVSSAAARFGVHRKTVHGWLVRYEAEGLGGLADRSHRPRSCPLDEVVDRFGRIDVLVNNAGAGMAGAAEESSISQTKASFETNVFAPSA